MSAPWEILGVAPNCPPDELRKAYAALLKVHRPDKDPEGFRRIRDAYEFMRDHPDLFAGMGDVRAVPADFEAEPPAEVVPRATADPAEPPPAAAASEAPAPPGPPPERSTVIAGVLPFRPRRQVRNTRLRKLARALARARRANKPKAERRALKKLLHLWRRKKTSGGAWDGFVAKQLQRDDGLALSLTRPADALRDCERDGTRVALTLLREHARRGAWPEVSATLAELEKQFQERHMLSTAVTLLGGAGLMALFDWKRAQDLVNAAYPVLPEAARQALLPEIDRAIQAGKEVASLRAPVRSVLASASLAPPQAAGPELSSAIRQVSYMGKAQTARAYLAERFPQFQSSLRTPPRSQETHRNRPSFSTPSSSGSSNGWWIYPALVLVVSLLRACNSSSNYDKHSYTPPPKVQMDTESRRRIEEFLRDHQNLNPRSDTPWSTSDPDSSAPKKRELTPEDIKKLLEDMKLRREQRKREQLGAVPTPPARDGPAEAPDASTYGVVPKKDPGPEPQPPDGPNPQ
ncbi:MAG: J domain-containing protein [Planctomycetota bacterium]|nr:J domain-containing protein [Planctomycetota bacterium]